MNKTYRDDEIQNFIVDYPVSVNACYKPTKFSIILTKPAKEYKTAVATHIKTKLEKKTLSPLGDRRVAWCCLFFMPDYRRRDVGNLDKVLADALTDAGLWNDDCQIDDQRFVRAGVDRDNPRVEIFVQAIEGVSFGERNPFIDDVKCEDGES